MQNTNAFDVDASEKWKTRTFASIAGTSSTKTEIRHYYSLRQNCWLGIALLACLLGCGGRPINNERKFTDVITHLENSGLKGVFTEKAFALVGASGGGLVTGDEWVIEVYHFQDAARAKSMENTTSIGTYTYSSGNVAVLIFEGKDKILAALKDF